VWRCSRSLCVLAVAVALVSGGAAYGSNSTGAHIYPSLQKADNELGKTGRGFGLDHSPLTARKFAALSGIGGFTSPGQAEIARRVRQEVLADRRTAARASAALREANSAASLLALIEAETTTPDDIQRGALAHSLFNVAADEVVYWKTLATEADLSAHIAPVFIAEASAEKAWARQRKRGAFAGKKSAKAALQREIDRALAPGLRLMSRENLLQRRTRRASHNLASDLFSLRFALRNYPNARRTAMRLMHDDPKGFLAKDFKRSN
jgi:hypothetical protein